MSARADSLQAALEEARAAAHQEAAVAGQLRSRVLLLEEEVESAKLAAAQAQQAAVLAAAAGAGVGVAAGGAGEAEAVRRLESELRERQRGAEERGAQLESMGRWATSERRRQADAVQHARGCRRVENLLLPGFPSTCLAATLPAEPLAESCLLRARRWRALRRSATPQRPPWQRPGVPPLPLLRR